MDLWKELCSLGTIVLHAGEQGQDHSNFKSELCELISDTCEPAAFRVGVLIYALSIQEQMPSSVAWACGS